MSFLDDKIKTVQVTAKHLAVELADGRSLRLPLSLFPTLAGANPKARARWELCAAGTGIHWPLLNYDLSAAGLLRGEPEAPGLQRARKSGKYPDSKPEPAMGLAEEPPAPAARVAVPVKARKENPDESANAEVATALRPARQRAKLWDEIDASNEKMAAVTRPPLRPSALLDTRVIYCGDNLEQLKKLPDACVDLIYIDPPFNSNRNYEVFWGETKEKRAFDDRHASTQAYIDFMRPRCVELARVLKKTGSFYYHCDWHASHYVKVMLDQIFGENNFINEIVWKRQSSHNDAKQGSKHYGRLHDVLLYYCGGSEDYTWNQQYVPLDQSYIESHYSQVDEKGRRFQWGDLRAPGGAAPSKGNPHYRVLGIDGYWRYTQEKMEQFIREGRVAIPPGGEVPRYKRFLDESKGLPVGSVWDDINPINSQAKESLGYPTQKPLPLLERIIQTSSNENDIVLDAFCGCGTALVAAQKLKRQWIGIDISPTACRVMAKRLRDVCGLPEDKDLWKIGRGFVVRDLPWTAEKLRALPPFEFENWAVIALGGIPNKAQVGDMGIDGRIFPVGAEPAAFKEGELSLQERWYPIQVKQKDKVGRPDVDAFETAMRRSKREKGFFIAFDYTEDALREIDRFFKADHAVIVPLTVQEILDEQIARKLV